MIFFNSLDDGQQEALSEFLEVDRVDINRRQRIILIAEGYDYSSLGCRRMAYVKNTE